MHQSHHHHFSYSESERRQRQNPESILERLGLKTGMCFVDLGCNDGFFTVPAAKIVGSSGQIYAADIDNDALSRLEDKLKSNDITNTQVIYGPAESADVCRGCADMVFLGTVLHDFNDPLKALINCRTMLKENGVIYDYDWKKRGGQFGPPYEIRFSPDYVIKLATAAGLKVMQVDDFDDDFYLIKLGLETSPSQ